MGFGRDMASSRCNGVKIAVEIRPKSLFTGSLSRKRFLRHIVRETIHLIDAASPQFRRYYLHFHGEGAPFIL